MQQYNIKVEKLKKSYYMGEREICAVDDVSFPVAQGEMIAIMGVSGSGKSTLLHLISGLDTPDSGCVMYEEQDIAQMTDSERSVFRAEHIGYVYQNFHLLPELTAMENIMLPLEIAGKAKEKDKIYELAQKIGMQEYLDHHPSELSGGQQQRVGIARAVINDPEVILCDEPTGALDSKTSEEIMKLFQELKEEGKTIVIVTHDKRIAEYCDHVLRLQDGKIIGSN